MDGAHVQIGDMYGLSGQTPATIYDMARLAANKDGLLTDDATFKVGSQLVVATAWLEYYSLFEEHFNERSDGLKDNEEFSKE